MTRRRVSALLWVVAVVLTLFLGLFQRMTGPSYPARGSVEFAGETLRYRLPRSHGGSGGLEVSVEVPPAVERGRLRWRHYPTDEPWSELEMTVGEDGGLGAELPQQPPAGKVEYVVELSAAGEHVLLPTDGAAVARYRGTVPALVLVPHILAMFVSMLLASRALLEVLRPSAPAARGFIVGSMLLLIVGGLLLGPIVQSYAFGAFWTGWPVGGDLTDNKTAIAVFAWLPATLLALVGRRTRAAVVLGWLVMMAVFLIPHSLRGSQLDWSAVEEHNSSSPGG
jgi:hypothetical protein